MLQNRTDLGGEYFGNMRLKTDHKKFENMFVSVKTKILFFFQMQHINNLKKHGNTLL